ncbi:MAG: DUF4388 domain-containing protein [Acidimicrobiales bacterium]
MTTSAPANTTTLRGTLADVDVVGVVTLVAAGGRRGVLTLNPPSPQRLVVSDGSVVLGGSDSSLALCRHLLACGEVTAEQVEQLLGLAGHRRVERSDRSHDLFEVVALLVDLVDPTVLAAAVRRQIVATTFEMLVLTDADWAFSELEPPSFTERFAVPAQQVLAEATEQVNRWAEVRASLGTDASYVRRVRRLPAHLTPVVLDALEWAALNEIEERATIGQIAHRLGLGRYDASVLLAGLQARGVIEPAG